MSRRKKKRRNWGWKKRSTGQRSAPSTLDIIVPANITEYEKTHYLPPLFDYTRRQSQYARICRFRTLTQCVTLPDEQKPLFMRFLRAIQGNTSHYWLDNKDCALANLFNRWLMAGRPTSDRKAPISKTRRKIPAKRLVKPSPVRWQHSPPPPSWKLEISRKALGPSWT